MASRIWVVLGEEMGELIAACAARECVKVGPDERDVCDFGIVHRRMRLLRCSDVHHLILTCNRSGRLAETFRRIDCFWTETQLLACSKLCRRRHDSAAACRRRWTVLLVNFGGKQSEQADGASLNVHLVGIAST